MMAVIGQSHLLWRSRAPDRISHSNTIVRIVPIEVVLDDAKISYYKHGQKQFTADYIVSVGTMIHYGLCTYAKQEHISIVARHAA